VSVPAWPLMIAGRPHERCRPEMARASRTKAMRTPGKLTSLAAGSATPECKSFQVIRAELVGDDSCSALGVTARGLSPLLSLCRLLVERGHDPDRPLEAWRGETLCLHIRSIGEAAELELNGRATGFVKRRQSVGIGPPVAPTAKCFVPPHKQAVLAAARRTPSS
jgi:hypothetical protein